MEMRFLICSVVDKHKEYTNILEIKKTFSNKDSHNFEETDYNGA
jgi:hypothetical protein